MTELSATAQAAVGGVYAIGLLSAISGIGQAPLYPVCAGLLGDWVSPTGAANMDYLPTRWP